MSESDVSTDDLHHPTKTMSVSDEVVIEIKSMHKWYGSFHVLKDINLKVSHGERIVVCGPSGSGKSTAIRCINRLEEHQKGQIIVNGIELTNDLKKLMKFAGKWVCVSSISIYSRIYRSWKTWFWHLCGCAIFHGLRLKKRL